MFRSIHYKALALACAVGLGNTGEALAKAQSSGRTVDPVTFSFAFFGCNRLDENGIQATGSVSTANEVQLRQSFRDIAKLPRLPRYVFLAGDIVEAKQPGTEVLKTQLAAWVALAADPRQNPLIRKGVPIVAFTGNHELLVNQKDGGCKYAQCPNPPAYAYWPQFMENNPAHYDFIAGDNGPKPDGADGVLNDESRLSYSFRSGDVLFVILNTDSQIDHDTIGDVPMHWLRQELQAAQRDAGIRHVFVMGHKPLQSGDSGKDPGDRTIRPEEAEAFYALLGNPAGDGSPSKVRAFLAAHAHEWRYTPRLTLGQFTGTVPHIIAGNGGSQPSVSWASGNGYFGYTLVEITRSGTVTVKSHGRPIGDPYYGRKTGQTTLRESYVLYAPAHSQTDSGKAGR